MANFHFSVKTFSRARGCCIARRLSYLLGKRMQDFRTARIFNFSRRRDVVFSKFISPVNALIDSYEVWQRAELAEKRANSTVARECDVTLPWELSEMARETLACRFATWLSNKYMCVVHVAIHGPKKSGDQRNHNAHLFMSTRSMDDSGMFGKKCRVLDSRKTGSIEIMQWRKHWEEICNQALESEGHSARVDCRSHLSRGLNREPHKYVGKGEHVKQYQAEMKDIQVLETEIAELQFKLLELEEEPDDGLPNGCSEVESGISLAYEQPQESHRQLKDEASNSVRSQSQIQTQTESKIVNKTIHRKTTESQSACTSLRREKELIKNLFDKSSADKSCEKSAFELKSGDHHHDELLSKKTSKFKTDSLEQPIAKSLENPWHENKTVCLKEYDTPGQSVEIARSRGKAVSQERSRLDFDPIVSVKNSLEHQFDSDDTKAENPDNDEDDNCIYQRPLG